MGSFHELDGHVPDPRNGSEPRTDGKGDTPGGPLPPRTIRLLFSVFTAEHTLEEDPLTLILPHLSPDFVETVPPVVCGVDPLKWDLQISLLVPRFSELDP